MMDTDGKANYQVIKVVRRARELTRPFANDLAIWRTQAVFMMRQAEKARAGALDARSVWQDVQGLMSVVLQRHAAFTAATRDESPEVLGNEMIGAVEKGFVVLTDGLSRTRGMLGSQVHGAAKTSAPARETRIQEGVH